MKLIRMAGGVLLAAFMVFMGSQKFGAENPIFARIAEQSDIALFEPVIRMATGVAELVAAVLILLALFMGLFRGLGALLSTGIIGGAIGFHLSPWLGISAPVGVDANGELVYSSMLFIMAVVFFVISAALTWLDREELGKLLPGKG